MSSKQSKVRFWISTWWPVALAIAVICLESTEFMGADQTTGPFRRIAEALFGHITDAQWDHFHMYIRKGGHFLGYGLVGLAWLRAWRRIFSDISFLACAAYALGCTMIIASFDEWHQTMLANRSGQLRDVVLDSFGALILITLDYLILRLLHRNSHRARRHAA